MIRTENGYLKRENTSIKQIKNILSDGTWYRTAKNNDFSLIYNFKPNEI